MNPNTVDTKVVQACRTRQVIMADASGVVPTRIEVIKTGNWPSGSNKGALEITEDDLHEYVANFKAGVGLPRGLNKLAIDYKHEDYDKAAGWMHSLEVGDSVHDDEIAAGVKVLYANVKWTPAGRQALEDEEFKCFSPSFWPACLGTWRDPENPELTARNVLVGAGLTNIPFFKGLNSIMASNASGKGRSDSNVIYISASAKENVVPTLDEVRIKEVADLTDEDRKVLADNKDKLSADERTKFDIKTDQQVITADNKPVDGVSDEDKAILADIRSGKKTLVEASAFNALQETVNKLEADNKAKTEVEVKEFVKAQIGRGAIVADQSDKWESLILADASMRDVLKNLPGNKELAEKVGSEDAQEVNASAEFETRVQEAIKASEGKLTYSQAVIQTAQKDAQLANAHEDQVKEQ